MRPRTARLAVAALAVLAAVGCSRSAEPPIEGEAIGKVIAVVTTRTRDRMGPPLTRYQVRVFRDSTSAGRSTPPGRTLQVWTIGDRSTRGVEDRIDGLSLSTIACAVGEKCFIHYRELEDGRFYVYDKWTLWRRDAPRFCGTAEDGRILQAEDENLERRLEQPDFIAHADDSLICLDSGKNISTFLVPADADPREYIRRGIVSMRPVGTLREVKRKIRADDARIMRNMMRARSAGKRGPVTGDRVDSIGNPRPVPPPPARRRPDAHP